MLQYIVLPQQAGVESNVSSSTHVERGDLNGCKAGGLCHHNTMQLRHKLHFISIYAFSIRVGLHPFKARAVFHLVKRSNSCSLGHHQLNQSQLQHANVEDMERIN